MSVEIETKNGVPRSLVIGASGFVGSAIWRLLPERHRLGTYFQNAKDELVGLDVRDVDATLRLVRDFRPSIIYMPAAIPSADACETNPHRSAAVTVAGAAGVAIAAREVGASLVYFSTDYVFNGESGPYTENDVPSPINVYGLLKLSAEEVIRKSVPSYLIIRLSGVYGYASDGKNFAMGVVNRLRRNECMQVPLDQLGTPTYVEDLAHAAIKLAQSGERGIFHIAGPETMDRYSFACLIAGVFSLDRNLLLPVATRELRQPAPRPLKAGLRTDKASKYLGRRLLPTECGLLAMRPFLNICQVIGVLCPVL